MNKLYFLKKSTMLHAVASVLLVLGLSACETTKLDALADIAEGAQLVIFSFGDSFVSGEGNPDVVLANGGPIWAANLVHGADICHRSRKNAHYLAVSRVADAWTVSDEEVYRNFACSGATTRYGLLGPQFALNSTMCNPLPGVPVPEAPVCGGSQIDAAEAFVADPANGIMRVDVVILSIGVNDLGFSRLIRECSGPAPFFSDCSTNAELTQMIQARLSTLESRIEDVIDQIQTRINPKEIIIVAYPDPTRDAAGAFCDRWSDGFIVGIDQQGVPMAHGTQFGLITLPIGAATREITQWESAFAYSNVLVPLNNALSNVAVRTGSRFVGGAAEMTRNNGVCAESHANNEDALPGDANVLIDERWFRTFKDSYLIQGDFMGSFHPNNNGHSAISELIERELRDALGLAPI